MNVHEGFRGIANSTYSMSWKMQRTLIRSIHVPPGAAPLFTVVQTWPHTKASSCTYPGQYASRCLFRDSRWWLCSHCTFLTKREPRAAIRSPLSQYGQSHSSQSGTSPRGRYHARQDLGPPQNDLQHPGPSHMNNLSDPSPQHLQYTSPGFSPRAILSCHSFKSSLSSGGHEKLALSSSDIIHSWTHFRVSKSSKQDDDSKVWIYLFGGVQLMVKAT